MTGNAQPLADALRAHLDPLLVWVERNGFAGWDPHDLWDSGVGAWATAARSAPRRATRFLLARAQEVSPLLVRRLLGVPPLVQAKGMGLFASAFLRLEALEGAPRLIGGEPGYVQCFRWLDANRVACGGGGGWGLPFDWHSRVLIPRGTPTITTSSVIGDAYWRRYRLHGDDGALAQCEDVCRFFLGGLHRSDGPKGTFCFSYTPVDTFQVHNANLLGAEFLVRVGAETGRAEWTQTGLRAARFSLNEIRADGTLSYWSDSQRQGRLHQDTYHAGFEIRALNGIARATGLDVFRRAADAYFQVWRRDYFEADGTPCLVRGSRGVVEVHSLAEALLCTAQMRAAGSLSGSEFVDTVARAFAAGSRALWVNDGRGAGWFGWARRPRYGTTVTSSIPLIRWGEAWMAEAMAAVLQVLAAGRGSDLEATKTE